MTARALRSCWVSAGFFSSIPDGLSALDVGAERLMLLRVGESVRALHRDCPHRGADLSQGVLEGNAVRCRFHGRRIALGAEPACDSVAEFPTARLGPLILVQVAPHDPGLQERARLLEGECEFFDVGSVQIGAPAELVVENAFDADHFVSVHGVEWIKPLVTSRTPMGALAAKTDFGVPRLPWGAVAHGKAVMALEAVAYGPHIVVSQVGESPFHYYVVTATRPATAKSSFVDQVLAFPRTGTLCALPGMGSYLAERTRQGLAADRQIWESMNHHCKASLASEPGALLDFTEYCAQWL